MDTEHIQAATGPCMELLKSLNYSSELIYW